MDGSREFREDQVMSFYAHHCRCFLFCRLDQRRFLSSCLRRKENRDDGDRHHILTPMQLKTGKIIGDIGVGRPAHRLVIFG